MSIGTLEYLAKFTALKHCKASLLN